MPRVDHRMDSFDRTRTCSWALAVLRASTTCMTPTHCVTSSPGGLDRKPTTEEALEPPDKRPWTEYDVDGNLQKKPDFKACAPSCCLFCGPTCCVFELQWCSACGPDADTTCDVLCRCRTNRMKLCLCCGPQRDDVDCDCCIRQPCCCCCQPGRMSAGARVSLAECCECEYIYETIEPSPEHSSQLCCIRGA